MENNSTSLTKPVFLIGIFLSIILPLLAISSTLLLRGAAMTFETKFLISRFVQWFALLLLFLFSLKIEKGPFLLWKEQEHSFLLYLKGIAITMLFLILAMLLTGILLYFLDSNSKSNLLNKTIAVLKNNFLLLFFTSVTAGIVEELIFRGYLLPRLKLLFKNTKLAIVVSSFFFGIMHYSYGTLYQTIGPMVFGVVLAVQYKKHRNIKMMIVCHFLWDFVVLYLKS